MIKQVKRRSTSLIMGSTNRNYSQLPAHIYQDGYYPQTRNTGVGVHVEKPEPLFPVGGNVKWNSHCGKQYGASSEK